jgi:hypothetical protein
MEPEECFHNVERDVMKRNLVVLALGCILWATPSLADPGRGATVLCYLWANEASPTINSATVDCFGKGGGGGGGPAPEDSRFVLMFVW